MTAEKVCKSCAEAKPVDRFRRNAGGRDGLDARCRDCNNAAQRARHAANPEIRRASGRAWAKAHPEANAASTARYRARHPDAVSKWIAANQGNPLARDARRRGAAVVDVFTIEELFDHLRAFGIDPDLCMYCHDAPRQEWDHILAICLGGPHVLTNIAPSCRRCNRRKLVGEKRELRRRRQAESPVHREGAA